MTDPALELVPRTVVSPSSDAEILLAEELRKLYGSRQALKGLSFSLKAGRVLGFLGPNGAGKTTAIRILTTILEPTSGRFLVDGVGSENPQKIRRRIGVLPESLGFTKHITGLECLVYFGRLYGRTAKDAKAKAHELLEEVGLQQRGTSLIGTYSRGMRQRLGIARALVNDPVVVFLDEPTLGLDPRGQQELLVLVRRIARDRNAGVVLCSHHLFDIEAVCDEVVILSAGEVVASGSVAEVIGRVRQGIAQGHVLRIQVPPASVADGQRILAGLPNVSTVAPVGETTGLLRVELQGESEDPLDRNRLLEALIRANIPVFSFGPEGGRLQDAFLHLTGDAIE